MRVYYFDDSGDRGRDPGSPWLVVGGFGLNADDVPRMNAAVRRAAKGFNFEMAYPAELKFYHVGKNNHDRRRGRRNWMLDAGLEERAQRRALVYSCLRNGLASVDSLRVIAVAVNQPEMTEGESAIVTAMSMLLDRVQMDSQDFAAHSLVMMDEEHAEDSTLRHALRSGSQMIKKYERVVDTIAFLPSEESPGIQLADLVAGSVSRYMNANDPGYMRIVWPRMRHRRNERNGYGIKAHPRGEKVAAPPEQLVPWPEFDRQVLEAECGAQNITVTWRADGVPSHYFPAVPPVPGI